ncbi:MAG: putative transcriptional regulator, partial [Paenibacillus sp.]|nr:putative transcriptional regulator [Paenibacillus sp.]
MSTPRLELWKIEHSFSNDSHVHDNYYQVTVPVYGSCRFEVENRSLLLESGEALIHCPNDRHSFQLEDGEGVVIFQLERDIGERWELKRPWEPAVKQQINVEELLRQHRKWLMTLCTADPSEAGSIE